MNQNEWFSSRLFLAWFLPSAWVLPRPVVVMVVLLLEIPLRPVVMMVLLLLEIQCCHQPAQR
jgi:hypothetical protein